MRRLCVIGNPVGHSLSPLMHNAALESLELLEEYSFEKLRVRANELADFVARAREEFAGMCVTMPHKQAIIPLLDILSKEAMLAGAVNTVSLAEGSVEGARMAVGHNTDGAGCVKALEAAGTRVNGRAAVLLGAGGAARAIGVSLALNGVRDLRILNRTPGAAGVVAAAIRKVSDVSVDSAGLDSIQEAMAEADILINATPAGMRGVRTKSLVPPGLIEQHMTVFDIVYEPRETKLLKDARRIGANAIPGTEMLLHQGALQFKIFTGKDAPIESMRATLEAHG